MPRIAAALIVFILAGCGGAVSGSPGGSAEAGGPGGTSGSSAGSPRPSASPSASGKPSSGRFVRILAVVDCPGGCAGYSIGEAIEQPGADVEPILVDGFLVLDGDGTVWFCEALTDTAPPGCAGARLTFEGQGAAELLEGARWSGKVQLFGTVHRP